MSAGPNQGNTVTLAVVQGESPNPTATFSQAMAARQVVVGSGPAAQWKVRAPGVEPAHVELYWDGAALWVRDGGSLSGCTSATTAPGLAADLRRPGGELRQACCARR
ncbi:MAG: hypothetical protein IPF99_39285 [Deltaproteobacteria bacterium]|nr:hypothetical protein [Deltaproteobacteria bacterium]